ncbi:protein C10-like [Mizuhopecten yessoensis]|uniref:Protein C10 n=1 Tax=Mizuhopecten yessoensis TaxID=6573 RepID=A0A210Q1S8_MIZYE|nr:protein C10-like [Mizuhopecten yessoensis]OWF42665.1 Protein C10 [Mizuhopecten yessoensis]
MAAPVHNFSVQDCKVALQDVLEALLLPENASKIKEAKDSAGNDMLRAMQIVFPAVTQIQMEVIERYGFTPDGDGVIRFTQTVKVYEKQDKEVAQLNQELKAWLIPPVSLSSSDGTDTSGTS